LGSAYSGTLWKETLPKWDKSDSSINWDEVPIDSTDPMNACPSISEQPVLEPVGERSINFSGPKPGTTYHIYRSQNASGAGNDASNGQYFWIDTVTVPVGEYGTYFTDLEEFDGPAWYLVIEADLESNAIIGCHSEEADPTNVVMGEFTAVYDAQKSAVVLEWETVSEINIIGFNVFRGTSDTLSDSVKINTDTIAAKHLGSPGGDTYTFEDDGVDEGQTYYYWIEILTNDSSDQTVGPESATIPEGAWFYYFLPLLFN